MTAICQPKKNILGDYWLIINCSFQNITKLHFKDLAQSSRSPRLKILIVDSSFVEVIILFIPSKCGLGEEWVMLFCFFLCVLCSWPYLQVFFERIYVCEKSIICQYKIRGPKCCLTQPNILQIGNPLLLTISLEILANIGQ